MNSSLRISPIVAGLRFVVSRLLSLVAVSVSRLQVRAVADAA
jgi:hypothetical protein